MTVACSTVLVAGAATGAVALWSGPVAAQPAAGVQDAIAGHAGTAVGATAGQPRLGQSLTDFEAQHSQAQEAAALRAATARAAARAKAAAELAARQQAERQRAAQLAAQRKAASQATPTPAPPATAVAGGTPQQIAMAMLSSYGWSSSQFSCLNELWERESGWSTTAANPSGAYGIPQALPGSKMASAGPDWETSATTQIKWGLGYIQGTYGSPCGAWAHEESSGWY